MKNCIESLGAHFERKFRSAQKMHPPPPTRHRGDFKKLFEIRFSIVLSAGHFANSNIANAPDLISANGTCC